MYVVSRVSHQERDREREREGETERERERVVDEKFLMTKNFVICGT